MGYLGKLWKETYTLSRILRTSDLVTYYSEEMKPRAFGEHRSELRGALESQFAMGGIPIAHSLHYSETLFRCSVIIPEMSDKREEISKAPGGDRLLAAGKRISQSAMLMLEWLRSRLPGYPFPLLPHVAPWSNRSCEESFLWRWVPWLVELRRYRFERFNSPPDIGPTIALPTSNINALNRTLLNISLFLRDCAIVRNLEDAVRKLSAEDSRSLDQAFRTFRAQASSYHMRKEVGLNPRLSYDYRESLLVKIKSQLGRRARRYYEAFEEVLNLLEVFFFMLSTLTVDCTIAQYSDYKDLVVNIHKTPLGDKFVKFTVPFDGGQFGRDSFKIVFLDDEIPDLTGIVFIHDYPWGIIEKRLYGLLLKDSKDVLPPQALRKVA